MTLHAILSHGRGSNAKDPLMLSIAERLSELDVSCDIVNDEHTQNPEKRTQLLIDRIKNYEQSNPDTQNSLLLIGHSLGGYASILASTCSPLVKGVVLLAPALWTARYKHTHYPTQVAHICVMHGWRDVTIIPEHSIRFAQSCAATCHLFDADHDFRDALPSVNHALTQFITKLASPV